MELNGNTDDRHGTAKNDVEKRLSNFQTVLPSFRVKRKEKKQVNKAP